MNVIYSQFILNFCVILICDPNTLGTFEKFVAQYPDNKIYLNKYSIQNVLNKLINKN